MIAHLLVPAWLLISGVTAADPPVQGNPAHLVLYRQREFGGNAYDIKVNDQKRGALPTNRYLQLDVPPGRVKIESVKDYFTENQTVWLDVQPGRTYYVKAVEEFDFMTRTLLLVSVRDEQAQRELPGIKPASLPRTN